MFQPGEEGFHGARYMIDEGLLDEHGRAGRRVRAAHLLDRAHRRAADPGRAGDGGGRRPARHGDRPRRARVGPARRARPGARRRGDGRRAAGGADAAGRRAPPRRAHRSRTSAAGTTNNVIPETAYLEGTLRTLSEPSPGPAAARRSTGCACTPRWRHGCTAEVEIEPGYPVTVNDADAAADGARAGRGPVGAQAGRRACRRRSWGRRTSPTCSPRCPARSRSSAACPPGVDPADGAAEPLQPRRVRRGRDGRRGRAVLGYALDALRRA